MLQMRQPGQRNLQTTAQIRVKLDNGHFYNISVNNDNTMSKRKALVLAVYVHAVRSQNKKLEEFIAKRLGRNDLLLEQLALYKLRLLSATNDQEVAQIQDEMVEKIGPLFERDEDSLLELANQLDPTVPVPLLSSLSPELAKQTLCSTGKYKTDMTVGKFHNNINQYVIVLNDNVKDKYDQGGEDEAVTIKQHAIDIRQAGDDVINGQVNGNVKQVNHGMERIIKIQRLIQLAHTLKGDKGVETLFDALNSNKFNTAGPGVFNSYNGSINFDKFVNEMSNNNSAVTEGESQFSFGSSNG